MLSLSRLIVKIHLFSFAKEIDQLENDELYQTEEENKSVHQN